MYQRRILAHHAVFTAYGFWLPNDPRGSWSDYVGSWELARFGQATKVTTRRSVAAAPHDYQQRQAAKRVLKYPPVEFTGQQCKTIGDGFRRAVDESGYVIHACSILPTHVHLVILRHERDAERIIGHLKARATQALKAENLHPLAEFADEDGNIPTPWTKRGWPVFLYTAAEIRRAIRYVEKNPEKEGKPKQRWSFVVPYSEEEQLLPARMCAGCGRPITPERLDAVPAARLCLSCQQREESNRANDSNVVDAECPRCAGRGVRAPLVWRTARDPNISGYFLGCSRFPECRYVDRQ